MNQDTNYEIIKLLRKYKSELHYDNELIWSQNKKKDNYDILKNTERIDEIDNILNKICNHKWETDYIDDKYGTSQRIIYCLDCELTKKN